MKHSGGAILIVALLATGVMGGVTIEVQPTAAVAGAFVRLGDVALIEGESSGQLAGLVLCSSPLEGQDLSVTGTRIRRRVVAALGSTDFTLTGLESCVVKRAKAVAQVDPSATASGDPAHGRGRVLEDAIRRFVATRIERTTGTVRIEFDSQDRDLLAIGDDRYEFKLISATNHVTPGPQSLRIHMFERGKPPLVVRSSVVKFTVVLTETVVVTVRNIRAGRIVTRQDITTEQREFRSRPPMLLRRAEYVVGATAKRDIETGRMIRLDDLKKTLLVHRGKAVTVHMIGRSFQITATCKALESGEIGAAIAVQGLDGRGKFYAIVTGPREAEVRMPGATSATRHAAGEPSPARSKVADATAGSRATTNRGDR
jgi:flagella basal body P-ring formation protein FlgA